MLLILFFSFLLSKIHQSASTSTSHCSANSLVCPLIATIKKNKNKHISPLIWIIVSNK